MGAPVLYILALHVWLILFGRLVRIAVSLAALTGTPLIITNVRGNR